MAALGEALERANRRLGAEPGVAGGARLPFRAAYDRLSRRPLEGDFARDPP